MVLRHAQSCGAFVLRFAFIRRATQRLTGSANLERIAQRLTRAGIQDQVDPRKLQVGKCCLAVAVAAAYVAAIGINSVVDVLTAAVLAAGVYFACEASLNRVVRRRQADILAALPAAIDILAIAVAGGATLDAAMDLYCERFRGPLADELRMARQEMALGRARRETLTAIAERCDVEPLRGFISAILQAERFGTPVAHTLRAQSQSIKMQRRQWVQEQLARAPVKMLMPMAGFVLPALLIVLLGPAALQFLLGS
jgi:tight adherence protein C